MDNRLLQFGSESGHEGRGTLTLGEWRQLCLETSEVSVKGSHRLEKSLLSIRELLIDVQLSIH